MIGDALWVLCPADKTVHLLVLQGPGWLVTLCQRSLPPELGERGPMPQHRRCPECLAAWLLPSDLVHKPRLAAG